MRRLSRVRDERGFTLVEMLAVMFIGAIVLAGVATLMQTVMRQSTNIVARTDANQRGRLVMDRMTREVRSQVCLDLGYLTAAPGLEAADKNSITFFTDLSNGTKPPVKRRLAFEEGNKRIVESEYPLTSAVGAHPTTFSNTASKTTILLTNVDDVFDLGLFRYAKYPEGSRVDTEPNVGITTFPMSQDDLAEAASIKIEMNVFPANAKLNDPKTPYTRLTDSVLVRNLNQNADYSPTNRDALRCE